MWTPRALNTDVLVGAAKHYAEQWGKASVIHPRSGNFTAGRGYVIQDFLKFRYKDEYGFLMDRLKEQLEPEAHQGFMREINDRWDERKRVDDAFEENLATWLAVDPAGEHIPGKIGRVQVGGRVVGRRIEEVTRHAESTYWQKLMNKPGDLIEKRMVMRDATWPVYAGEEIERDLGSGVADELPEGAQPRTFDMYATEPRISNAAAIAACNAIVDLSDGGTGAAIIRGYTTAQATDPDTAIGGQVLCFTLVCTDPAFGAAADGTPGGVATADTITDDSDADDTQTLAWCRLWSTNDGATPLTAIFDGEAAAGAGADYNFNTLSIVSGSTVSMSALTVTVPES